MLSLLLGLVFFSLKTYQRITTRSALTVKINEKLEIRRDEKGEITLTDWGFLNSRKSINKYVEFELQQNLITNFGRNTVDHIELLKPGAGSFEAAIELCRKGTVRDAYIAFFKPFSSKRCWAIFFEFKRIAEQKNIKILRPIGYSKNQKTKTAQK